jgi:hypothetical protein
MRGPYAEFEHLLSQNCLQYKTENLGEFILNLIPT